MAQSLVKLTPMYGNRYEAAYDKFVHNRWFDNQKWSEFATSKDSTDLDMYIDALSKSDSINMDKYKAAYNSDYEDSRTKLLALYNEIYKDTDNFTYVDITDDSGKTKRMKMSMYEYNRMAISDQNLLNKKLQEEAIAEEDNFGDFMKKLPADVGSAIARVGYSAGNQATGLVALFPTLFKTVKDGVSTGEWNWISNWDKYFFDLYDIEIEGHTIREYLDYMDQEYGHFRDEDGNLTTPGRWLTGAAETVGSMLGSVALTYGIGSAAGAIGKLAGISAPKALGQALGTFVYYAPISMESASQTKQYFEGQGISMSESVIMTEQLVKTAVEIGIEQGLGKIFGRTGQDIFTYGGKSIKGAPKAMTKAGFFLDRGKDILQEATEEVLQEMSGVAVDNLTGLLGKAFPTVISENFGEISELSWQNIADAAIVAAIVSGGHTVIRDGLGVLSTKSTKITDGGNVTILGKFESYLNKLNMSSYMEAYMEAQKLIVNELKKTSKLLPSESRLKELENKRESILRKSMIAAKELIDGSIANSIGNGLRGLNQSEQSLPRITADQIVNAGREITDREAYDKQFGTNEPVNLESLDEDLKKVDDEIAEVRQALETETIDSKINDLTNKRTIASRKRLAEGFTNLYASFRMLEAFTNRVGKERIEKAEAILNKATKLIEEGKFNSAKIIENFNKMVKDIKLSGTEVSISFAQKMREAKMTKLSSVNEKGKGTTYVADGVEIDKATNDFTQKIYETYKASRSTIITEDGTNPVEENGTIAVPKNMVKLGVDELFESLAEQRLVEELANREYKGDVLRRVTEAYRRVSGDEDATTEKAFHALLFDQAFFTSMLVGDRSNDIPLAETTMYQFISSIRTMEEAIIPKDLRDEKYKKKMTQAKKNWTMALLNYLKIQPFAPEADYLPDERKTELLKIRENREVGNRFVAGNPTKSDIDFMDMKLNSTLFDYSERKRLRDLLFSKKPADVKRALIAIDNKFYLSFVSLYDGKFYMPTNSSKNQAFNYFLYEQGGSIESLFNIREDLTEKYNTLDDIFNLVNNSFKSYTNDRYSLEQLDPSTEVDAQNGIFKVGNMVISIVDNNAPLGHKYNLRDVRDTVDKTYITRSGKHDSWVNSIISTDAKKTGSGYYNINDVVRNPSLLSAGIRKDIEKEYGVVDQESTYLYLRTYFANKKWNATISLDDDGNVVFVNVENMKGLIADKLPVIQTGTKVGQVVTKALPPYVTNCTIKVKRNSSESSFEHVFDSNGERGVITIGDKLLKNENLLRFSLAHEIQHAIQQSNRLNKGNNANLLASMDEDSRKSLIESVKKNVPQLFKNSKYTDEQLVNDFLYYSSGEISAYGSEISDKVDFYPVLIRNNIDDTKSITLPWGDSYRTGKSTKSSLITRNSNVINDYFYSKMEEVLTDMKQAKIGANDVVKYLTGRGVKKDEIKYSGIEEFLDGKKSVSKDELLEFVRNNMLQIEEVELTESDTRFVEYSYSEGQNYRELLFKMPDIEYTNKAMSVHWTLDEKGVLVHTRVSDINIDGESSLFIDEIQSDWHNEGQKVGYRNFETDDKIRNLADRLGTLTDELDKVVGDYERKRNILVAKIADNLYDAYPNSPAQRVRNKAAEVLHTCVTSFPNQDLAYERYLKSYELPADVKESIDSFRQEYPESLRRENELRDEINDQRLLMNRLRKAPPDAPLKNNYTEFVVKRLISEAVIKGYDSISWTPSDMQMHRWNRDRKTNYEMGIRDAKNPEAVAFQTAYENEYDKAIVKTMKDFGKSYGVQPELIEHNIPDETWDQFKMRVEEERSKLEIDFGLSMYAEYHTFEDGYKANIIDNYGAVLTIYSKEASKQKIWSMKITPEMREALSGKKQVLYSKSRSQTMKRATFLEADGDYLAYLDALEEKKNLLLKLSEAVKTGDKDGKSKIEAELKNIDDQIDSITEYRSSEAEEGYNWWQIYTPGSYVFAEGDSSQMVELNTEERTIKGVTKTINTFYCTEGHLFTDALLYVFKALESQSTVNIVSGLDGHVISLDSTKSWKENLELLEKEGFVDSYAVEEISYLLKWEGYKSYDEFKDFYERAQSECNDSELLELSKKVFDAFTNLRNIRGEGRIQFVHNLTDNYEKGTLGSYDPNNNDLIINLHDVMYSPDYVLTTLTHELIHYVTSQIIIKTKSIMEEDLEVSSLSKEDILSYEAPEDWRPEYKAALTILKTYEDIESDPYFKDDYGITNEKEMLSELANPIFREKLKKKNLFTKIIDAIKRLLGIQVVTAYDSVSQSLETILTEFKRHDYYNDLYYDNKSEGLVGTKFYREASDNKNKTGPGAYSQKGQAHMYTKGQQHRKRVSQKDIKANPILEKYKNSQLSDKITNLIVKSTKYDKLDPTIKRRIENGSVNETVIWDWLYNTDGTLETDKQTFELINETFFQNKYFNSIEQLDKWIDDRTGYYYAIRVMLRNIGKHDDLKEADADLLYDHFKNMLISDPSYSKKFLRIANDFNGRDIDVKNLRRLYLQWFDGSFYQAGRIGAISTFMALNKKWNSARNEKYDKHNIESTPDMIEALNDFAADANDLEVLQAAIQAKLIDEAIKAGEMTSKARTEFATKLHKLKLEAEVLYGDKRYRKMFWEMYNEYVDDDLSGRKAVIRELFDSVNSKAMEIINEDEAKLIEQRARIAESVANKVVKPSGNFVNSIKSANITIKNYSGKPSQKKALLEAYPDIFDSNLNVKAELYKEVDENGRVRYLSTDKLIELKEVLLSISKEVRAGYFSNKTSLKLRNNLRDKISTFVNDLAKFKAEKSKPGNVKNINIVTYQIGDVNFGFETHSGNEMPVAIQELLNTELKRLDKTRVQYLSEEDDHHFVMSMSEFIDTNAILLNSLTQRDISDIIGFLKTSRIAQGSYDPIKWDVVRMLMEGYLLKMNESNNPNFSLDREDIEFLVNDMRLSVSGAGTKLSVWNVMLKDYDIAKQQNKALLKICDIELDKSNEDNLLKAVKSGNLEEIQKASNEAYKYLVKNYKGRKRTIWDRLLRWERIALLSGPNTWARNYISNKVVTATNSLSEIITRVIPTSKKETQFKQYKISGTKVTSDYLQFIDKEINKSGLLDLIRDGFTKYDVKSKSKTDIKHQMVRMITQNLENRLFEQASSTWKGAQKTQDLIAFMMSDQKALNKAMLRYLGKMMVEDKTDISNGLTNEVLEKVADAYTMASFDYMHKPNFWSDLEHKYREKLYKKYGREKAEGIFFMYKQVFPFAGASWNWFLEGLNFTPIALVQGIKDFIKLENTVSRIENARAKGEKIYSERFAAYLARRKIGKGAIGTVGLILGIILVACGRAGIDRDDDEYKLRVGNYWIDISDFYGTTGILTGVSIAQTCVDSKNGFNWDLFIDITSNALDTMFMNSAFSDLFNSFRGFEQFSDYLLSIPADIPGMMVPNFVKSISSLFKRYDVKYNSGIKGQLERFAVNSFGPFANALPYKVNPYTGEPQLINNGMFHLTLINKLTNIKVSPYSVSDNEKLAFELGVYKTPLTGRYKVDDADVKLTADEVRMLNEFYGKLNNEDLTDFFNNKVAYEVEDDSGKEVTLYYSKMTDKQKAAVIKRIMSNNGSLSKIYILTETGKYKYYASNSEYDKLSTHSVTKNVYHKSKSREGFVKN